MTRNAAVRPAPAAVPACDRQSLEMVRRIARTLARRLPRSVELDELYSAGLLGLAEAYSRRDQDRAEMFWKFAEMRARGAMLDYLRGLDHLSRGERRAARAIATLRRTTEAREGRAPSEEEVRAAVGAIPASVAAQAAGAAAPVAVDLEAAERTEPDAFEGESPEEALMRREEAVRLRAAIRALPRPQADTMEMLYDREMTLKAAGARLGVTESRACQLRGEAIRRLRVALAA